MDHGVVGATASNLLEYEIQVPAFLLPATAPRFGQYKTTRNCYTSETRPGRHGAFRPEHGKSRTPGESLVKPALRVAPSHPWLTPPPREAVDRNPHASWQVPLCDLSHTFAVVEFKSLRVERSNSLRQPRS